MTLNDRRLALSSLSILARSAIKVISAYARIYAATQYNLVWQNVRQISTCAQLVLLCFWRFEITRHEAEDAIGSAAWMLQLMEPRWGVSASEQRRKILIIADTMGE